MNSDCDSLTPITDAPAASTNDVDREMDVIQPSGEHGNSTGVSVVAMKTPVENSGTTSRKTKYLMIVLAPSRFLK
jgi:hypothetical protein